MPVAHSYENYALIGEPFEENKRLYVYVAAPKGQKKVRWYSDTEYKRMYPDAVIEKDIMNFDARTAFGFGEKGYITIYKGDVADWAENDRTNLWYNLTFQYYTPSHLKTPSTPEGIIPIKLKWEDVAAEGNKMKPHEEVIKIIRGLICKS